MSQKKRLDLLLIERGLVESLDQARRLIMAGKILVNEQVLDKPGMPVIIDAALRMRSALPYVSRGGLKLAAALDAFDLDVSGLVAVDVGASTGGFTDCLLQRGIQAVYAVDVGYGQLAWKLRNDERVTSLERTNIRHLKTLPPLDSTGTTQASLAVIDTSFISLRLVLPPTLALLTDDAQIIALIKPQFEARKKNVGKGGVVRESEIHRQVLNIILAYVRGLALVAKGLTVSPAPGPAGNIEFLLWMKRANFDILNPTRTTLDSSIGLQEINKVLQEAKKLNKRVE